MKKFLFALIGLVISLPSWAGVGNCSCCEYVTDNGPTTYFRITFGNDQDQLCDNAGTEITNFVNSISDLKQVILFAFADNTGTLVYNDALAMRRMNAIKSFIPHEVNTDVNQSGQKAFRGQYYRSVLIFPVQKPVKAICEDVGIKDLIDTYGDGELIELKEACGNESLDNDAVISIISRLAKDNPGITQLTNFDSAYKLYAELLKDTEDLRLDTSVWRTADGKFNTARLASDSIAGVVLGTVGGVVTSTVMKKSQVKNGLEDIKCVIGGQTVASYDDQFSVGLK